MLIAISTSSFGTKGEAIDLLKKYNLEIRPNPFGRKLSENEIIDHLKNVDGLIAGLEPLNKSVLSSAKKLKAIARVGIGMENIDLHEAKFLNIIVSNTPDAPTDAVAEMCLTNMLTLLRGTLKSNNDLHQRKWTKYVGIGLQGTNVLFIGYGRIGRKLAEYVRFLGAKIFVYDPYLQKGSIINGEILVSLEEGLSIADVITLHASGETEILTKEKLSIIKPGAFILNSARGSLINEDAIVEALSTDRIKGAWFDTFWSEPYQGKLCDFSQVILTPHISTYTEHCRKSMELAAVKNLLRDLKIK